MLNDEELIGHEIGYFAPKKFSRKEKAVDIVLFSFVVIAVAVALWGAVVTHSLPFLR